MMGYVVMYLFTRACTLGHFFEISTQSSHPFYLIKFSHSIKYRVIIVMVPVEKIQIILYFIIHTVEYIGRAIEFITFNIGSFVLKFMAKISNRNVTECCIEIKIPNINHFQLHIYDMVHQFVYANFCYVPRIFLLQSIQRNI